MSCAFKIFPLLSRGDHQRHASSFILIDDGITIVVIIVIYHSTILIKIKKVQEKFALC